MPKHAVITKIGEVQRVGSSGQLEQQMEVVFNVGDDGPFRIIMPSSQFSKAKVMPLVEERAAQIREVRDAGAPE